MDNYMKGELGESCAVEALRNLGYIVESHRVEDKGIDVKAHTLTESLAGEIVNWHGGYMHAKRFSSIVESLMSQQVDTRIIIHGGVKFTVEQHKELKDLNIIDVYLPTITKENHSDMINLLTYKLGECVITLSVNIGLISPFRFVSSSVVCCLIDYMILESSRKGLKVPFVPLDLFLPSKNRFRMLVGKYSTHVKQVKVSGCKNVKFDFKKELGVLCKQYPVENNL